MTVPRIFVDSSAIQGSQLLIAGPEFHHLTGVLRLKAGDEFGAIDGSGVEWAARIVQVDRRELQADILSSQVVEREPAVPVLLAAAALKGDKFDWVVQKATELGASRVLPVLSGRVTVSYGAQAEGKAAHWSRIARHAACQSGRARVPVVDAPAPFHEALIVALSWGRVLVLDPAGQGRPLRQILQGGSPGAGVAVVVGPEGGFALEEVEAAVGRGAVAVTLGWRTLRAETAALVGLALVQYELGALGAVERDPHRAV